jgi:ABC-2 type transport system permease protein
VLEPNRRNTAGNRSLAAAGVISLFVLLMFFGQAVAQGVTEEKSSRVVELLLTTISPRRLLAGKVLGIGALGLAMVLLPGAAALAAGSLAGGAGLPAAAPKAIGLVVLWFVLGYLLFSVAYAAVGAMVSRQEDLATAQIPIYVVGIAGFLLADIVASAHPNGTLAQVGGFLPPFSAMVVPARMVVGHMSWIDLTLAVALDLLATAGLIVLAARVYERSILQTGARVKLTRVMATGAGRLRSLPAGTQEAPAMKRADTTDAATGDQKPRLNPLADIALRMAGVGMVLAGAVIGSGRTLSIVLVALGALLIVLVYTLRRWPQT